MKNFKNPAVWLSIILFALPSLVTMNVVTDPKNVNLVLWFSAVVGFIGTNFVTGFTAPKAIVRGGIVIFFGTLLLSTAGCGHVAEAKQSLSGAQRLAAAGVRGWEAWDEQHQTDLATAFKATGDIDGGKATLEKYRKKQGAVKIAIASLDTTFAAAQAAIALIEAGGKANLVVVLSAVFTAAMQLRAAIEGVRASEAPPPIEPAPVAVPPAPISYRRRALVLGGALC